MACIHTSIAGGCGSCSDVRSFCRAGVPTLIGQDGWLWFDSSNGFQGYVWCDSNMMWNPFGGGTPTPGTGTDTADYWFFMLMGTSNARP